MVQDPLFVSAAFKAAVFDDVDGRGVAGCGWCCGQEGVAGAGGGDAAAFRLAAGCDGGVGEAGCFCVDGRCVGVAEGGGGRNGGGVVVGE